MAVRGDSRRLDRLVDKMDRLADGAAARRLVDELGAEALELVDEGFDEGRAPSGRRWPQPQYRSGPPMILTGRLRRSYSLRVSGNTFEIVSSAPYASRLQRLGRRTVPEPAEITARWDRAMRGRAKDWMRSEMA